MLLMMFLIVAFSHIYRIPFPRCVSLNDVTAQSDRGCLVTVLFGAVKDGFLPHAGQWHHGHYA